MVLKHKEALFAEGIARGMSQNAAAVEAGYATGTSSQLMRRPAIQQRIAELNAAVDARRASEHARVVVPTRDWVMRQLVEGIIEAKQAKDRGNANRGLELVGKEIGMFVTRSMQIESPLQALSADRLVALLQLIEQAIPGGEQLALSSAPLRLTIDAEPTTDDSW